MCKAQKEQTTTIFVFVIIGLVGHGHHVQSTVTCPSLAAVTNGVTPNCTNGNAGGSICNYQCNTSFEIGCGSVSRTCSSVTGTWNGTEPTCVQTSPCGRPALADSGVIHSPNSTEYQHGDTVTFSCEVGYFLEGETTAVCQLGSWNLDFNQTCKRDVRLLDGSVRSEGRVEVYWQSRWCVVCDDYWDLTDANVVCRQLGYPAASEVVLQSGFGDGEGEILLDDVMCNGYESSLIKCGSNGFLNHDCSRNEIAGVVCATESTIPFDSLRLIDGPNFTSGRIELYYNNFWGTVCGIYFGKEDANFICRQLGFYAVKELYITTYLGVESRPILRQLGCEGNEKQWTDCPCFDWNTTDCSHEQDAGVTCKYADEGDIRLTGGDGYRMGTVEIYHDYAWGIVCDHDWNISEANVVCRQLGFEAAVQPLYGAFFGQGQGQIVLDDVYCTEDEERLDQCQSRDWYSYNCREDEAAGVECYSPSPCVNPILNDTRVELASDSTRYQHNNTVVFSCPSGYELMGNSSGICQFGKWRIVVQPTCKASKCGNPSPNDTRVKITPDNTQYQHNNTVDFSCPSGYELMGNSSGICQFGSWRIVVAPTCKPLLNI